MLSLLNNLTYRNKECPTCRKKLVSKRSLRPDPNFDALISKIYPSRDEYEAHQVGTWPIFYYHWVRSISFPRSTPVCPQYIRIALTSFQRLIRVSPKCPACGTGHFGLARGARRHHKRASDRSISSCTGLT